METARVGEPAAAETGDPSDPKALRRALGQFATGVTIVTAADDAGMRVGVTANSFSSLSLDPPLVLWSLANGSTSRDVFMAAGHFAVNVLASDQVGLANRFARSGEGKYEGVAHAIGLGGAPLLDGAAACFECRKVSVQEAGDHRLFIGRVERFSHLSTSLLGFAKGRYGIIVDHPEAAPAAAAGDLEVAASDSPFISLLRGAFVGLSEEYEAFREAQGHDLTVNEGRVLWYVARHGGVSGSTPRELLVSGEAARDALESLQRRGYVEAGPNGAAAVTRAGRDRLMVLRRQSRDFETRALALVPPDEVEIARRVLRAIASR